MLRRSSYTGNSSTVHGGGKRRGEEGMSASSVLILGYVGPFAHHLIDRQRGALCVVRLLRRYGGHPFQMVAVSV